jgi:hypothetical protein
LQNGIHHWVPFCIQLPSFFPEILQFAHTFNSMTLCNLRPYSLRMKARSFIFPILAIGIFCLNACGGNPQGAGRGEADTLSPLFRLIPVEESGVAFANNLYESDTLNYFNFEYFYNGAGVAVGDLDNDGLPDLFFSGNQEQNKVYRNLGGLRFEDMSEKALPKCRSGWNTGVNMVDINMDGLLDIYVCRSGPSSNGKDLANLLFLNKGDFKFEEKAQEFAIADSGHSIQAIFFDPDHDGDLDMYLMNHPPFGFKRLNNLDIKALVADRQGPTHRFYQNNGKTFEDRTDSVGCRAFAFGLGLAMSDLGNDGGSDLYIANDFEEADFMYDVSSKCKFENKTLALTKHISFFGMGVDIADFNNDGNMDIIELDMAFPTHNRSKRLMASMQPAKFYSMVRAGFHHQYMQNTLQMNIGNGSFVEVAQVAGVAKTDWSWAPLFADLDNDGRKDLLITNGFRRDTKDNDVPGKIAEKVKEKGKISFADASSLIPTSKVRNYLYRNLGGLDFIDKSEAWGFVRPFNSNGAAYSDLDLDGDLELIISNVDEPAAIYENMAVQQNRGNYLQVSLKQGKSISPAYGKRVVIKHKGTMQCADFMPTRGYLSSVDPLLHFGLGDIDIVDTLEIWLNGPDTYVLKVNVPANQKLEIDLAQETPLQRKRQLPVPFMRGVQITELGIDFAHLENPYEDFAKEILLPHKQSQLGPTIATADVDGNGTEDFYVGGATSFPGALFLQGLDGKFTRNSAQTWFADKLQEDLGCTFFDADGDKDMDLYVVSGSNELANEKGWLNDRLYLNDGKGNFTKSAGRIPADNSSGMAVTAADIDADGDMDLFVGGRAKPGAYPSPDRSFLLRNDGGKFTDITQESPSLLQPGLVNSAIFEDLDGDKDLDLLLAGEWMKVTAFENVGGKFVPSTKIKGFENSSGWWYSLRLADLNGDGKKDILAGNLGLNSKFHASEAKPVHLYYNDFDKNGVGDIVLGKLEGDKCYPVRGRECSSQQMPFILDKFPTYAQFAEATIQDIYSPEMLEASLHLQATEMRSGIFFNQGGGNYSFSHPCLGKRNSPP